MAACEIRDPIRQLIETSGGWFRLYTDSGNLCLEMAEEKIALCTVSANFSCDILTFVRVNPLNILTVRPDGVILLGRYFPGHENCTHPQPAEIEPVAESPGIDMKVVIAKKEVMRPDTVQRIMGHGH